MIIQTLRETKPVAGVISDVRLIIRNPLSGSAHRSQRCPVILLNDCSIFCANRVGMYRRRRRHVWTEFYVQCQVGGAEPSSRGYLAVRTYNAFSSIVAT